MDVPPERIVSFRPRAILTAAGVLLGLAVAVLVVWSARQVLSWVMIALFLAMALNPAVEALQRRSVRRRGYAVAAVFFMALAVVAGMAGLFIPLLVHQVSDLIDAAPHYVKDLTNGRGPLGFLETKYHVVERVQSAVDGRGSGGSALGGGVHTALSVTKGIATGITGLITIIFMTLFMLLEGPAWVERFFALIPPHAQPRWRAVGRDVYRTIGGYVSGNLLISLIAGLFTAIVLLILGVPYAFALGLVVAILDLLPLAGATLAAVIVTLVALTQSVTDAVVVGVFFIVYQQAENHILQPVIYGRTVQLSPLAVLISILIGAELAGILGALAAIPVAGAIQVVIRDWLAHRPSRVALSEEDGQRFERPPVAPDVVRP